MCGNGISSTSADDRRLLSTWDCIPPLGGGFPFFALDLPAPSSLEFFCNCNSSSLFSPSYIWWALSAIKPSTARFSSSGSEAKIFDTTAGSGCCLSWTSGGDWEISSSSPALASTVWWLYAAPGSRYLEAAGFSSASSSNRALRVRTIEWPFFQNFHRWHPMLRKSRMGFLCFASVPK